MKATILARVTVTAMETTVRWAFEVFMVAD